MKVAFETLGCRVNQYETEAMTEKFINEGFEITPFEKSADVYVINTCTVTNMGDKKSRQMIGRARRLNPIAVIAVVGCHSQVDPENVSNIKGVDIVLGTRNKGDIVLYIKRFLKEKKQIVEVNDVLKNDVFEDLKIEEYQDRTRAFLKIQDGCSRFCSYCLIPFARGAICSKEPSKVIDEVKKLVQHGFKEIILTGIHIASYGYDLKQICDLTSILQVIDKIEGVCRIRIGSIDPQFFKEDTVQKLSHLTKLCPQFHLSLQSGCDETLKRMNRRYTASEYKKIVEDLRHNIPDVSITTDIIVGFPGETQEEFNETYNFLKNIKLSKTHIFKYSPRKGTRAALMQDAVDGNVKEYRSHIISQLDSENEKEFMLKFIGRKMQVLYEQRHKIDKDIYEGFTPNYIKVTSKSKDDISGQIINTQIEKISDSLLIGKVL